MLWRDTIGLFHGLITLVTQVYLTTLCNLQRPLILAVVAF